MVTNADRAAWAEHALEAFRACHGADGDTLTDIGDLIVDLCHLARRECDLAADEVAAWLQAKANMHAIELAEDDEE